MIMRLDGKQKTLTFWKNKIDKKTQLNQFINIDITIKYKFALYLSGNGAYAELLEFNKIYQT